MGPANQRQSQPPRPILQRMRLLAVAVLLLAITASQGSNALARSMEASDAEVLRKVAPAVVSISVWKVRHGDQPSKGARRVKTYGSGWVLDPSGIIVTNQHVIEDAIDIKIILLDGTRATGTVIGASPMTDVAVVKIAVDHPLPNLTWGDSDALQVGDPVLTLGNGLGLGTSVSAGIVSALNRNFSDSPFDSYIQTDAVINHGNSGGPMIDRDGHVVGVSEALINPDSTGFIGVGLAIPTTLARFETERLLDPKHVAPGWLGFALQDVTPELAAPLNAPRHSGAIITIVEPSGPASRAALKPGDVVDQIDGQALNDSRAFMRAIAVHPPGDVVHLTIWRDGQKRDVEAKIGAWPADKPAEPMPEHMVAAMMAKAPDLGVSLATLAEADRKKYAIDPKLSGVLVSHVEADSEASDLGVREGDVVTIVQGRSVTTPDDVRRAVEDAQAKHLAWIAVLLRSKTSAQWIPISIAVKG